MSRRDLDPSALLDDLPDAVLVVDDHARVQWANRAAEEMFERRLEDSVGMSCLDLVHPDDLEMAVVSMSSMMSDTRTGLPLPLRIRTPSGWRLVELIGRSSEDGILLAVRDLTQRRRLEVAGDADDLFRTVLQHVPFVTMVIDPDGRVRAASAALTRLLGVDQLAIEGEHVTMLAPERQRGAIGEALHRALTSDSGAKTTIDVDVDRGDHTVVPVEITFVNLVDDLSVGGLVATLSSISRRRQAERDLGEANAVLAATLESVSDAIVAVDGGGVVRAYNHQYLDMWDMPERLVATSDIEAMQAHVLAKVVDPVEFVRTIEEARRHDGSVREDTIELIDGRLIERRSQPRLVDGAAVGRVWSFRDVTATRRLQAELAHQATHDPLTGLANGVLFRSDLEAALAGRVDDGHGDDGHGDDGRADDGSGRPNTVAALFVDLDDFKAVNDTLGHSAGDALLIEVASRLAAVVRASDTVARIGGDEFAIVLRDLDSGEAAIDVARRLMDALSKPVALHRMSYQVGASIGIAVAEAGIDHDGLLRHADVAMYQAKNGGRNQFRIYTPDMESRSGARSAVDTRLQGAAERGELRVHYQPIVDPARDDAVVVMEALVRWQHPERGLVMPDQFIPYAERSGTIDEVGMHVLEVACRDAAAWIDDIGPAAPMVSVNLSPHQLLDDHLPDRVATVVDDCGLDPSRLVLEFTESALMQDPATVVAQLARIRRWGVRLAIDDFGTGHSSLARLQQFPIDSLKIDRTFVRHVEERTGSSLVLAIVQLAHTLDMLTVAEGVETPEQQARLDELGCDLAQGFWHHRPMDREAVADLLGLRRAPLR